MENQDDIVTKIIMNEIRNREKQNKIKDVITTKKVNTSKSIHADDEYTLLLKKIVNERIEKKIAKDIKMGTNHKYKSIRTKNNEVKCNIKTNHKQKSIRTKNNEVKCNIETKHEHKSIHAKNNEVKCNVCKQLFSMKYFTIHLKLHDNALYTCKICGKNFSYLSILNRHKSIHNYDSVFGCKLCSKAFRCPRSLSIHSTFHEWERINKCRFCFKIFSQYDDFLNHINKYTFDKPFLCGLCKKTFKTSQSQMDHHKFHKSEDDHYVSCSICKMRYADRDTIIKYAKCT